MQVETVITRLSTGRTDGGWGNGRGPDRPHFEATKRHSGPSHRSLRGGLGVACVAGGGDAPSCQFADGLAYYGNGGAILRRHVDGNDRSHDVSHGRAYAAHLS